MKSTAYLPFWVERPPGGSRGLDPLGLQAHADTIADTLLPDLSVLTWRARYFSFLCWARQRVEQNAERDLDRGIHRWEVALAFREALLSKDEDHAKYCPFVGSRNLAGIHEGDPLPSPPSRAYRTPVWHDYRSAMAAMRYISRGGRWCLTPKGKKLAEAWGASVLGPKSANRPLPEAACLSRLSVREKDILRADLGILLRGARLPKGNCGRRAAFFRELRPRVGDGPGTILPRYERRKGPSPLIAALNEAVLWERISLGLNGIFLGFVHSATTHFHAAAFEGVLEQALRSRISPARGPLEDIPVIGDQTNGMRAAVASLRRARQLLPAESGKDSDVAWAHKQVARALDARSASVAQRAKRLLEDLNDRHCKIKGEAAWVMRRGSRYLALRAEEGLPTVPTQAQPHAYRIAAFAQLAKDLA